MVDAAIGLGAVEVQEEADAALETAFDIHLLDIEEGDIVPARSVASGGGGENGVEVSGDGEGDTDDVVGIDVVVVFQGVEKFGHGVLDRLC